MLHDNYDENFRANGICQTIKTDFFYGMGSIKKIPYCFSIEVVEDSVYDLKP